MPLCSSSFLCVASFCSVGSFSWHLSLPRLVGLFATVSSFGFHLLLSLTASSVPLFLLCSTLLFWVVLRSLVLVALLPSLFWLGSSFLLSRVFSSSCLGFLLVSHGVFLSCTIAFLSSSRLLLLGRGSLCALFFPPSYTFSDCLFCLQLFFLYSIPVSGSLPRPTFVSLVSFLFFSCLVFLFCALTSGPPGVSPVTGLSSAGHPTSFSSTLAAFS